MGWGKWWWGATHRGGRSRLWCLRFAAPSESSFRSFIRLGESEEEAGITGWHGQMARNVIYSIARPHRAATTLSPQSAPSSWSCNPRVQPGAALVESRCDWAQLLVKHRLDLLLLIHSCYYLLADWTVSLSRRFNYLPGLSSILFCWAELPTASRRWIVLHHGWSFCCLDLRLDFTSGQGVSIWRHGPPPPCRSDAQMDPATQRGQWHARHPGHGTREKEPRLGSCCAGKDSSIGAWHPSTPTKGKRSRWPGTTAGPAFQRCLGFKRWLCFCTSWELPGLKVASGARLAPPLCPLCGAGAGEGARGRAMPEGTGDAAAWGGEAGHSRGRAGGSAPQAVSPTAFPLSAQAVNQLCRKISDPSTPPRLFPSSQSSCSSSCFANRGCGARKSVARCDRARWVGRGELGGARQPWAKGLGATEGEREARLKAEPAGNPPLWQGAGRGVWPAKTDLGGLKPGAFSVVSCGRIRNVTERKPWSPERICRRVLESKSRLLQRGEGNQILWGVLQRLCFAWALLGKQIPQIPRLEEGSRLWDPPSPDTAAGARCKHTECLCCKGTLGPLLLGVRETEAGSSAAARWGALEPAPRAGLTPPWRGAAPPLLLPAPLQPR